MENNFRQSGGIILLALIACAFCAPMSLAQDVVFKPGDVVLHFTKRSPMSSKDEIGHRLNVKDAEMTDDYDLSQCAFHIYFPVDFDTSVPQGVIVYLGDKDTDATPAL